MYLDYTKDLYNLANTVYKLLRILVKFNFIL